MKNHRLLRADGWKWRRFLVGWAAVLAALWGSAVTAASPPSAGEVVPRQIPYRGYLDQNGVPVTNTNLSVMFELFTQESGGSTQWGETQFISVVDGQFTAALGDAKAIPAWLFAQPSLYLQITVDGQVLAGRQRLLTVPYAQYAGASFFPISSVIAFGGAQAPAGWLLCDGQAVSRTQYPQLFAAIGTVYGVGDGSSTFNVPDLRGRFLRGLAAGEQRPAGQFQDWATGIPRAGFGTTSVDLSHSHNHMDWYYVENHEMQAYDPNCNYQTAAGQVGGGASDRDNDRRCEEQRTTSKTVLTHSHAVTGGDAETRPANVGVNFIIRATP